MHNRRVVEDAVPSHAGSGAILDSKQLPAQTQQAPTTATDPPIEHLSIFEPALDTNPVYPTGAKFWFAAMALFMVLINGGLDANIVATALPSITDHFHTVADVGWYSSAFRLSSCAFQFGYAKMINLPIGGASLATMVFLFPNLHGQEDNGVTFAQKIRELDLVSNCLFIPSLTTLFLALSWGGVKYAWSDGRLIGLLATFAILLATFLVNQYRRGDSAALPFRIITTRSVISGFIFTACTNSVTNVLEWYLPTFYQVAQGRTPRESGYLMIPILAGMMVGLILQGIGTTRIGYYAPFMLFASLCMPIATGLMTTYGLSTSLTHIICYSGFVGFGAGIGFQGPQAAVQTALSNADVNLGVGVILFGQSLGPAVFVAIAQVIFTNDLSSNLAAILPGLTPAFIEKHGLGNIRELVSSQQQDEVLQAIATGLTHTWYLPVALACTTMVGSVLVEWRSVKRKQS
ncbi:hypothetical protein KC332_g15094 [Hortaea werneckii]|nr:hypothetical protein KC350_g2396 [Hortaea werneckii]KAI6850211.1 hypothetical protein KC358_g799 [Hortaea werneckii]KAI6904658.1 hypothetical protein KC348_g15252 [Hortaea werneckii]KAI6923116.1 hypothetical protein KC341_g14951 [Hortaea werneckii]KAI6978752.1 hypothetical protein KC321_g2731 [Hortaea werneckii]